MSARRHNLTQWLGLPFLFIAGGACEEAHEASRDVGDSAVADSSSVPDADAEVSPAGYELCDGSERIRFGYQSGGGQVDEGYFYLHPYGYRFLFMDGRCDFLLTEFTDAPGAILRGHLDEAAAAEIEAMLQLEQLKEGTFIDELSCPDAGDTWLATAEFFGNCTCDCEPPPALGRTLGALEGAFARLRTLTAADSGKVELVAVMRDPESSLRDVPDWPFSWPVTDVLNDGLWESSEPLKLRVLEGDDADVVRTLRSEARAAQRDKRLLVQSGDMLYELFARDQIEAEVAAEIARFSADADPR